MIAKLPNGNNDLDDFELFSGVDFIVTDLDGTLISGPGNVLKQIKDNIIFLRRYKVQITIATGRTYAGAQSLMKEIDLKVGMPVALYNGSVVIEYGTDNVLYCNPIGYKIIKDLIDYIDLLGTNVYIYTFAVEDSILVTEGESRIREKVYGLGRQKNRTEVNDLYVEWMSEMRKINEPILAVLIEKKYLNTLQIEYIKTYIEDNSQIVYTDSGSGFIEVKGKGLNKGIIIQILRQRYRLNAILAIGDNDNDKELFQGADIGVAVENSSVVAIETADYVCENESAEGFSDMLEVIKSAKKYYEK